MTKVYFWWFCVIISLFNLTTVFLNLYIAQVTWLIWANAIAAIYCALRAGSYPTPDEAIKQKEIE